MKYFLFHNLTAHKSQQKQLVDEKRRKAEEKFALSLFYCSFVYWQKKKEKKKGTDEIVLQKNK